MPDAITLLEQDHRKVETLFAQWQQSKDSTVAEQICTELTVHALVEEQTVYPALAQDVPEGEQLEEEAEEEHAEAKQLIAQIETAGFAGPEAEQAMETLISAVSHHVQEEESEIFPKMRQTLGDDALQAMGAEVAQVKQQAQATVSSSASLAAASGMSEEVVADAVGEDQLIDLTKEELYQMAQDKNVEGRADMNKDQLIRALSQR